MYKCRFSSEILYVLLWRRNKLLHDTSFQCEFKWVNLNLSVAVGVLSDDINEEPLVLLVPDNNNTYQQTNSIPPTNKNQQQQQQQFRRTGEKIQEGQPRPLSRDQRQIERVTREICSHNWV